MRSNEATRIYWQTPDDEEYDMTSHSHAVIWIDHHVAKIFHFNATDVEGEAFHPHDAARHIHHKANSIGSGHSPEDRGYFDDVAHAIADAGAVLVMGPANAKLELVKHIARKMPSLSEKISGVETVDHPTDGEIVAAARKHFRVDHQMPYRAQQ